MAVSSCAASREPPLPGFRACPHPPPCGLRCNRLYPADRSRRDTVPFLRFTLKPTRWLLLLHLQSPGLFPKKPGSLAPRGHMGGPHKEAEVLARIEEDRGSPPLDTAGVPGFWASVILAEPIAWVKPTLSAVPWAVWIPNPHKCEQTQPRLGVIYEAAIDNWKKSILPI